MGMVKIIVATMKRRNIQIGGIQKVQILKKLIFVSIFRAINAFVPFISTNLKLKIVFSIIQRQFVSAVEDFKES